MSENDIQDVLLSLLEDPENKNSPSVVVLPKRGRFAIVETGSMGPILLILLKELPGNYLAIKLGENPELVEKLKSIGKKSRSGNRWDLT